MVVRVDLNISLDGFATTTDQTPEVPFGEDWPRLVCAYAATRTVRERVFKDTTGAGTTGVDDEYAKEEQKVQPTAGKSNPATLCERIGVLLDVFPRSECGNFLVNSGYASN